MNGGTCMLDTAVNEHYCKCPPNVRGRHCQFGVKECKDGMYCMVRAGAGCSSRLQWYFALICSAQRALSMQGSQMRINVWTTSCLCSISS